MGLADVAKIAFVLGFFVFGLTPGMVIVERRLSAWMQGRIGPDRVGPLVIPFGSQIGGVPLQVANLSVGVLFTMSVLSVAVYGLAFGGWASNNKYSLLGGLRASAQLVSYELALG